MQLVGAWNLVSWNRRVGETEEPGMFGVNPLGLLTCTSDGHFCVAAMSCERASLADADVRGGTVPEKAAAYEAS